MRYGLRIAAAAYVVAEFLTPSAGIIQAHAQAAGAQTGDAFLNQTVKEPAQVGIVGPLYKNRLSVNPDGSINTMPVNKSTPGGVGAVTVTSTSTTIIPAGPRRFIAIDNESTTATIACSFGGTAATNAAGSWTILPGQTRIWNSAWVPSDALNCISSASTSAASVEVN